MWFYPFNTGIPVLFTFLYGRYQRIWVSSGPPVAESSCIWLTFLTFVRILLANVWPFSPKQSFQLTADWLFSPLIDSFRLALHTFTCPVNLWLILFTFTCPSWPLADPSHLYPNPVDLCQALLTFTCLCWPLADPSHLYLPQLTFGWPFSPQSSQLGRVLLTSSWLFSPLADPFRH